MKNLVLFISMFIIVYIVYFAFVISRKKVLKKFVNGKELKYLKLKYKLDYNKINIKSLSHVVALSNAFILSVTVTVISYFKNFILSMLVGFIILIPLILVVYHIIGTIYSKSKGGKK